VDSDQVRARRLPIIRARGNGTRPSGFPIGGGGPVPASFPLIGLGPEQKRIETALRDGESLLVLGPRGCGKTHLLRECSLAVQGTAFVQYTANLHLLLRALARALVDAGHDGTLRSAASRTKPTSVHLRGVLWNALERHPARIIIDGIDSASFPVLRFFRRIYFVRGMSIVASARDAFGLGALARLFWDPRKTLQLNPLNDASSAELFEQAAHTYGVHAANMDEFRSRVLDAATGNGGEIVEMCRLASRPEYLSATGRIKFELVRIDCLVRTMG
jgi:energy-coupling factor transporter ATP-binding protein EcfA2